MRVRRVALNNAAVHGARPELAHSIVYARFFLAETFPLLQRLIYLDTDLVVLGDIAELWRVDLHGRPLGAIAVALSRSRLDQHVHFDRGDAQEHLVGFNSREAVFNNGVMVLDLEAWRSAPPPGYEASLTRWVQLNTEVRQRKVPWYFGISGGEFQI